MEPASVGLAVLPALGAIAGRVTGQVLLAAGKAVVQDRMAVQAVAESCLDEWLESLFANYDSVGVPAEQTLATLATAQAELGRYFEDEKIIGQLFLPFTGATPDPELDSTLMLQRWQELGLPDLPEDFSLRAVNRRYVKRLTVKRLISTELRTLLQAQVASESLRAQRAFLGHWPEFDIQRYGERFRARYRVLELSALTPPDREALDIQMALTDIFVPQDAREAIPHRDLPHDYKLRETDLGAADGPSGKDAPPEFPEPETWDEASRQPARQILGRASASHFVVLGDPGSGKTTLARDLCLRVLRTFEAASRESEAWLTPFVGRLPLYIQLRLYVAERRSGRCQSFVEYLHYLGKSEGYGLNAIDLGSFLLAERSLVVFDGLDEVLEPQLRRKLTEEIVGFTHEFPLAKVLVTSRIHGYDRTPLTHAGFSHLTLDELSDLQIGQFAEGWFGLVFKHQPEEARKRVDRIDDALRRSPALSALARNPLILTIIAIIARHRELPRDRARLYDQALRVFVFHWDATAKFDAKELSASFMDDDDKIELLRGVARRMATDDSSLSSNVIVAHALVGVVHEYLASRWRLPEALLRPTADAIVQQLRERNFILCQQGPDLFGFVHRTFLEYLMALELQVRFEKDRTLDEPDLLALARLNATNDTWAEPLRLLCGMLGPAVAARVISAIVPPTHLYTTVDVALAAECLAELRKPADAAPTFGLVRDALIGRAAYWRSENVRRALSAVTTVDGRPTNWAWTKKLSFPANADSSVRSTIATVLPLLLEAFAQTGLDTVPHLLRASDPFVRAAAVELLTAPANVGAQVLHRVLACARAERDTFSLSNMVTSLARHIAQADVLRFIQSVAHDISAGLARVAALQPLVPNMTHDDARLAVQSVFTDANEEVRSRALQTLRPPKAVYHDWLRWVTEHDPTSHIRAAALRFLATEQALERDFLIRVVLAEGEAHLSGNALAILCQEFRNDPEVHSLVERLTREPDKRWRSIVIGALDDDFVLPLDKQVAWLEERILSEQDGEVTSEALYALGYLFASQDGAIQPSEDLVTSIRAIARSPTHVASYAAHVFLNQVEDGEVALVRMTWALLNHPNANVRRSVVFDLRERLGRAETGNLLLELVEQKGFDEIRSLALSRFSEHLTESDALRVALRGLDDSSEAVRRSALQLLSRAETSTQKVLLTRDLDGREPWIDPTQPVSRAVVDEASRIFSEPEGKIRSRYEELAQRYPIRLGWVSGRSQSAHLPAR